MKCNNPLKDDASPVDVNWTKKMISQHEPRHGGYVPLLQNEVGLNTFDMMNIISMIDGNPPQHNNKEFLGTEMRASSMPVPNLLSLLYLPPFLA